jgi:hypothetical protein
VSSAFERASHDYLLFASLANRNALMRSMFAMATERHASSIFIAPLISLSRRCSRSKTVSASARWLSSIIVSPVVIVCQTYCDLPTKDNTLSVKVSCGTALFLMLQCQSMGRGLELRSPARIVSPYPVAHKGRILSNHHCTLGHQTPYNPHQR